MCKLKYLLHLLLIFYKLMKNQLNIILFYKWKEMIERICENPNCDNSAKLRCPTW